MVVGVPVNYEFHTYTGHWTEYEWILIIATFVAFISAFGIGANDVANAFGSSVGAKAITMTQAIMIAAVCEFAGASLLGAGVTDTIKSKVANSAYFTNTPQLLMYGMLCVMCASAFWDNAACHLGLPVSTTHTTVGAIVGMSLAIRGSHAVVWSKHKAVFPYVDGMTPIFLSWVVSPLCSGILCCILFLLIRTFILRSQHSFQRAFYALPVFVFLTFFIITIFILQTGNKNATWNFIPEKKQVWISFVVAIPCGLICAFVVMPFLRKSVLAEEEEMHKAQELRVDQEAAIGKGGGIAAKALADIDAANVYHPNAVEKQWIRFKETRVGNILTNNFIFKTVSHGANYDVHAKLDQKEELRAIWEHAEVFDYKTERLFRYLQVFSAMVMSFAHGSNDIANAMGPYSAVVYIYTHRAVPNKSPVPEWILLLGGAGIVLGLATYGYKIMRVLGVKAVKLTNTRGFCAELSTAATVIIASRWGLPVSTTQVIYGSIMAIGLMEGVKGVNWKLTLKVFFGWVMTLVIAGFVGAGIAAWGVYSPNKHAADSQYLMHQSLDASTKAMLNAMLRNGTLPADLRNTLLGYNATLARIGAAKAPVFTDMAYLNLDTFDVFNRTQQCRF